MKIRLQLRRQKEYDVNKVKEINPFGVILGKALYENKVSIEEVKKLI